MNKDDINRALNDSFEYFDEYDDFLDTDFTLDENLNDYSLEEIFSLLTGSENIEDVYDNLENNEGNRKNNNLDAVEDNTEHCERKLNFK